MENIEKKIAGCLLEIKAVFLRPQDPFTWASGIKSPIYCDNRLTLSYPAIRSQVEQGLAENIRAPVRPASPTPPWLPTFWACPCAMSGAAPRTMDATTRLKEKWNRARRLWW